VAEPPVLTSLLTEFASELRSAGLSVGTGEVITFGAAMACLDPADLVDVYWSGRAVFATKKDNIVVYDAVFRAFFLRNLAQRDPVPLLTAAPKGQSVAALVIPATEQAGEEGGDETALGLMASDAEVLRHKAFTACTPAELAAIRRIMTRIALTPPRRRTRRTEPARRRGRTPDLRRTIRSALRTHGDPARLMWRRRRVMLRPLILFLDISGSMADYSRNLLQFAYSARRVARLRVEVFCFGTRLTRITRELDHRSADEAIGRAARTAFDWDGGTRIGASLDAFVRDWGRRGLARGGIVVICSDGFDRGDPTVLASAMDRLARLSHRVVWITPHGPGSLGLAVAEPHLDLLLRGADLASLERLAELLPALSGSAAARPTRSLRQTLR